jgi:UDP-glucose 4-epimerase
MTTTNRQPATTPAGDATAIGEQTVLMTGSEGNLGPYLRRRLAVTRPGWKVLRVKRREGSIGFDAGHDRYEGDLRDSDFLDRIFSEHRIDHVVHAASRSYSHAGYRGQPFQVVENDSAALLNILRHSKSVASFVYLSSALLYEHAADTPLREDDSDRIPAPTSSYGVAKHFGEHAVRMFGAENGVATTIWRPFNIVSPLEPHEGDGRHVFVDFFRRLLIEKVSEFKVLGSGQQVRCFMWVEDAAEAIADSLGLRAAKDQTFNLARTEPITLLQLKELLLELGRELEVVPRAYDPPTVRHGAFSGVEAEVRIPSVAKVKAALGWESRTTVRECFRLFVEEKLK